MRVDVAPPITVKDEPFSVPAFAIVEEIDGSRWAFIQRARDDMDDVPCDQRLIRERSSHTAKCNSTYRI